MSAERKVASDKELEGAAGGYAVYLDTYWYRYQNGSDTTVQCPECGCADLEYHNEPLDERQFRCRSCHAEFGESQSFHTTRKTF